MGGGEGLGPRARWTGREMCVPKHKHTLKARWQLWERREDFLESFHFL